MADETENAIPQILRNIQTSIAEFRREVSERLDRLEKISRKQRRDAAGMLVLMRATAGDFDERVSDLEQRMDALTRGHGRPRVTA